MMRVMLFLLLLPVLLEAQVTEVWSTKGPDDYPFGLVLDVVPVGDELWVLDPHSDENVHVLDGSGRFLRRLVRDGDGPTEMRSVNRGAVTPEGHVMISNFNQLKRFTTAGEYVGQTTLPFYPAVQNRLIVTEDHIIHAAGARGPAGNHPHQVFVYDRAGELVSSFHPSYPLSGTEGLAQSRAVVVKRHESLIVVNAAPIEIVEYALTSGRKLRTIVPADSSLVKPPGDEYYFELSQHPGARFRRRLFPRVRYAELLEEDRLLMVTVFPWEDYPLRPEHLVLDTPVDEFERSVWDVYDLTTGERLSRTDTPRAYVPTARTSDGAFVGYYTTRLEESVVVMLRLHPEG